MEQKELPITAPVESAFSILQLLSDEQIQVQGPDEAGGYTLRSASGALPEGASGILTALEGLDSLRVPAERLGKDLRRFLKDRDLTGGGMLLLAGLRLFFIRQEGRDTYGLLMDRRFQETAPMPEVRLQRLIAALRAMDGQKGLFHTTLRRVYRAVEIPGILLENVRIAALEPHEVEGLTAEGKVFVLAGGLTREERARAKALITAQGGRCATSLSGRTDYLAAGTMEKLRENTLLQFRALQSKGREIQLLNAASLFTLLGEAYPKTGSPAESASIESLSGTVQPPIPETAAAETVPGTVHPPIPETAAAETVPAIVHPPIPETAAAETVPAIVRPPILETAATETVPNAEPDPNAERPPIPETTVTEAAPAIPEEPVQSAASLLTEVIPAMASAPILETVASGTSDSPVANVPASTDEKTNPQAELKAPDRATSSGSSAAEGAQSTMEPARAAEARAITETSAQIERLQETLVAKERHLQTLGRWKFGERIAARQEIHRLNQILRSAKAELSRLTANIERTAT